MRYALAILLAFLFAAPAWAGSCDDPGATKQSAALNVGSATTAAVVTAPPTLRVHVCSFAATLAGTSPTVKFLYGTQSSTACDTGATALSGAFAPTAGQPMNAGYGDDLFIVPPGQQLCVTVGGTSPSLQGVLTYAVN